MEQLISELVDKFDKVDNPILKKYTLQFYKQMSDPNSVRSISQRLGLFVPIDVEPYLVSEWFYEQLFNLSEFIQNNKEKSLDKIVFKKYIKKIPRGNTNVVNFIINMDKSQYNGPDGYYDSRLYLLINPDILLNILNNE